MNEKQAARLAVAEAIREGDLARQPCEKCGGRAEAHHDDYARPLDVRWLCRRHHRWHHAYDDAAGDSLGARIRQARVAAGLTQPEFGAAVGVGVRTVSLWEAGTRAPWRYIAEICIATRTPLAFFFNGDDGEAKAA